jgi:UDP-N-acetyl-D-mannosaminuronic acid dehydrogenase
MTPKICMIGLGYIGLPTATLFASRKIEVVGVDVLPHVVETINQGRIHIVEPELDMLVQAAVTSGYLRATTTPEAADAFLVAVPTPFSNGFKPDLTYVGNAAASIAPVLKKGDLVILESTSPVGTTEQMAAWLAEARPDLSFPQQDGEEADVQVAHCPERVLPGHVVRELVENDRVIGGLSRRAAEMAYELYKLVVEGECLLTDARTAEMCKLAENSFRDTNIAFANELSIICGRLGVDVWELIALANRHPRVDILRPGPGVGGHCIAVDPWFLVDSAQEEARLIRTAREVNDSKPGWVVAQAREAIEHVIATRVGRKVTEVTVACLGLAFKPDIDDLRESPAVQITADIATLGCQVFAVEPHVKTLPARLAQPNIRATTLKEALDSADVLCLLVKHREFREVRDLIARHPVTIDTVGLLASSHPYDG